MRTLAWRAGLWLALACGALPCCGGDAGGSGPAAASAGATPARAPVTELAAADGTPAAGKGGKAARRGGKGKRKPGGAQGGQASAAEGAERRPGGAQGAPAVERFLGRPVEVLAAVDGGRRHDFGTSLPDRMLEHVFAFRWQGAQPLVPERLRPNCGCLEAKLLVPDAERLAQEHPLGTPLPAGSLFAVAMRLDTRGMGGANEKKVVLACAEPPGVLELSLAVLVRE